LEHLTELGVLGDRLVLATEGGIDGTIECGVVAHVVGDWHPALGVLLCMGH